MRTLGLPKLTTSCTVEDVIFDWSCRLIVSPRARKYLRPKESELLLYLIEASPRWVPMQELAGSVWGYEPKRDTASCRQVIASLRRKVSLVSNRVELGWHRQRGYQIGLKGRSDKPLSISPL